MAFGAIKTNRAAIAAKLCSPAYRAARRAIWDTLPEQSTLISAIHFFVMHVVSAQDTSCAGWRTVTLGGRFNPELFVLRRSTSCRPENSFPWRCASRPVGFLYFTVSRTKAVFGLSQNGQPRRAEIKTVDCRKQHASHMAPADAVTVPSKKTTGRCFSVHGKLPLL